MPEPPLLPVDLAASVASALRSDDTSGSGSTMIGDNDRNGVGGNSYVREVGRDVSTGSGRGSAIGRDVGTGSSRGSATCRDVGSGSALASPTPGEGRSFHCFDVRKRLDW